MNFHELLQDIENLQSRKAADYAKSGNPFSNFEYAAKLAGEFNDPVDRVFASIIGIKLARLIELQSRPATNEPVTDTRKDLAVYALLWYWWSISHE